jgi:hypothetical protein
MDGQWDASQRSNWRRAGHGWTCVTRWNSSSFQHRRRIYPTRCPDEPEKVIHRERREGRSSSQSWFVGKRFLEDQTLVLRVRLEGLLLPA